MKTKGEASYQSLCEAMQIELPSFNVTSLPCLSLNFRVAMISLSSRSLGDKLRVAPGSWTSKSWPRTYCSTSLRTSSSTLLTSSVDPCFWGSSEFRTIATASDTCNTDNNQLTWRRIQTFNEWQLLPVIVTPCSRVQINQVSGDLLSPSSR